MPKLLIGSLPPEGEKMLGCEQKKERKKRKKRKKREKNQTKISQ